MSCTNNLFATKITSNNLGICEPSSEYFWIGLFSVLALQIARHYLWTRSGKNHRELLSLSIVERNKRCDLFAQLMLIQLGKSVAFAISIILLISGNGYIIIAHVAGDFIGSWVAFHLVHKDAKHLIENLLNEFKTLNKSEKNTDKDLLKKFIEMLHVQDQSSESDRLSLITDSSEALRRRRDNTSEILF